jgi:hypothetical protein
VKKILLSSLISIIITQLSGQNYSEDINLYIEKVVEHVVSNSSSEEEVPVESLTNDLEYLYRHPLDLNKVTQQELEQLWILNDFQIKALLSYRKTMKQFISVYEVQYIFGFNKSTFELIAPFLKVGPRSDYDKIEMKKISYHNQYQYLLRMDYKPQNSNQYNGLPLGLYSKFTIDYKNQMKIGILAENDAGEYFFNEKNRFGFDFYSAHLQLKTNTLLKCITLGDFKVRSGQGLLIWNGFKSGKSSEILSTLKRRQGIQVNRSKNESNFLRGAGFYFAHKHFNLHLYGSIKYSDAVLDTINGIAKIKSISTTGYHRTRTENLRKHNNLEKTSGAMLYFTDDRTQIGINLLAISHSFSFLNDSVNYKPQLQNKIYSGASADFKLLLNKYHFFGEVALHQNTIAVISGINFLISPDFKTSVLYRYYPADYYAPYSNAFGENSNNANEKGLYTGFQWQKNKQLEISAYTDIFNLPWYSFSADNSSRGAENQVELKYSPTHSLQLRIRYKHSEKEKNVSETLQPSHQIETYSRDNIRVQLASNLSSDLSINSRFEVCRAGFSIHQHNAIGYLAYQDIIYLVDKHTRLKFRYAFFNIGDFNTRIYAYEHDVLYGFSIPAYYGNGHKTYILIQRKLGEKITLWLKYSFTQLFDESTVCKHLFKTQIRLKF